MTYTVTRCMPVDRVEKQQLCSGTIRVPLCDGNCLGGRPCCVNRVTASRPYAVRMVCSNGETIATYKYGPIRVPTSCRCVD